MIRKKAPVREIVIDLTGPEGNAFVLMGWVGQLVKWIEDDWEDPVADDWNNLMDGFGVPDAKHGSLKERILAEMKSGDYEHLVQTFDKYFGHFVILER